MSDDLTFHYPDPAAPTPPRMPRVGDKILLNGKQVGVITEVESVTARGFFHPRLAEMVEVVE